MCTYLNKILDSPINHKKVYRLMKELGIKSIIRRKYIDVSLNHMRYMIIY
ncbi:IS3 family transposase [Clostridioides difficile]